MIKVSIEVHSITQIQKQAAQAFVSSNTNPYAHGSIAHRIWARRYEECAQEAASAKSGEKGAEHG